MTYMIAIGSNRRPQRNVPDALKKMLAAFGTVRVGRFFRTKGHHMSSAHRFWNGAVMVDAPFMQDQLKQRLFQWEKESGHDRSHSQCSTRDRTLDLDMVWGEHVGWLDDLSALKDLPYLWQPICSLLTVHSRKSHTMIPVRFKVQGVLLGSRSLQIKKQPQGHLHEPILP